MSLYIRGGHAPRIMHEYLLLFFYVYGGLKTIKIREQPRELCTNNN